VPTISALRAAGRGRVAVELDGSRWRTVPAEVVVRAGLEVGAALDRLRLRTLRRELRRAEALETAARALRARDRSAHELGERLADVRLTEAERAEAIATLERAGLVDDERFARARASGLADRGYGDRAIADALARHGVGPEARRQALEALDAEPARASTIVTQRGGGPRTAAYLARRGFSADAVEAAVGTGFFAPDT
jgi:regulatory protein